MHTISSYYTGCLSHNNLINRRKKSTKKQKAQRKGREGKWNYTSFLFFNVTFTSLEAVMSMLVMDTDQEKEKEKQIISQQNAIQCSKVNAI